MTPTMIDPAARFQGDGQIRLSGDFTGTLTGKARLAYRLGGDLTIASGSVITIGDEGTVGGSFKLVGTLTNHGTIRWLSGYIDNDDGPIAGQFFNEADGTFEIQCASSMNSVVFTNKGTIRQSATDYIEASLNGPLNSTGAIFVLSGRLNLGQPYLLAGVVNAASGTTIECYAGMTPLTLAPSALFGGDGDIVLSGDISGTLAGKARLAYQLDGDLTIAPGSTVTIKHNLILASTLINHGTILWQDDGTIYFPLGIIDGDSANSVIGHFFNESEGVLDIQCDNSLGSSLTVENKGTILKSGGTGTTTVNSALTNAGVIDVRTGWLSCAKVLMQTAGATRLSGGNLYLMAPAKLHLLGGELQGAGTLNGDVLVEQGTLRPGNNSASQLQITGNLTLGLGATFATAADSAAPAGFGHLIVAGNTALAGNFDFSLSNGFVPAVGTRFRVIESTTCSGAFSSSTFPALPTGAEYFANYSATATEIVAGVTSLADWKALHFGAESDPTIVGDNADPDADGATNLLEYAFGLEPLTASRVGLPLVTLKPATAGGPLYLTMTFTTPATVTDLDFTPQVSGNLAEWLSGPGHTETISDSTTNGIRTVVVRDTVPVSSGTRRFMRLHVALKP